MVWQQKRRAPLTCLDSCRHPDHTRTGIHHARSDSSETCWCDFNSDFNRLVYVNWQPDFSETGEPILSTENAPGGAEQANPPHGQSNLQTDQKSGLERFSRLACLSCPLGTSGSNGHIHTHVTSPDSSFSEEETSERSTLVHGGWECPLVQPLWKQCGGTSKFKNRTAV